MSKLNIIVMYNLFYFFNNSKNKNFENKIK